MPGMKERSGGTRPGAGRKQSTYRLTDTPARQLRELAATRGLHPEALLTQLIADAYRQTEPPQEQLLAALRPEPQTITALCKKLQLPKAKLEHLIRSHLDGLIERGMQLHVATVSDTTTSIKLPSSANPQEPTYYNRISKNLFSLAP